jgi:NAD(P)-dependent dehydrogenase (short-subunit alcohol dehydrogenase family)
MISPFSLEGEIALITGGGTGLGLAIAHAFSQAGARVCITGRREDMLAAAVGSLPGEATYLAADVNLSSDRAAMLSHVIHAFGTPISILVNNAGQNVKNPALDVTDEAFDELLNTHVKATFALARDAAPAMIRNGKGSIIFIASMASFMGIPSVVGYTAAKTAVLGLTRSLAAEWSPAGVRVNAIAPGWISSAMTEKAFDADPVRKAKVLSRTPMGKMGKAEDIGNAAVYLSSPAAAFVTGQCIAVDGGASIGF